MMDFASWQVSKHSLSLLLWQAGSGQEVKLAGTLYRPELNPPEPASVTPDSQRDGDLVKHEVPHYRKLRSQRALNQSHTLHIYEKSHQPGQNRLDKKV